ncbi:MAG TPA: helix-turn-helix transcriptional regulator [Burkholderiales bacterium]|nr:helix-turn-helix transcriptional regulator [Burkholderiales bacterium]
MSRRIGEKKDWHPADVIASLWKKGISIRALSVRAGYSAGALKHALRRQYPAAEKIIADAIGVRPMEIWPSRYHEDGTPHYPRRRTRREGKTKAAA